MSKNKETQVIAEQCKAEKESLRLRYPIYDKVESILAEADLQGLIRMGAPKDEYAPEAMKIVPRLITCGSVEKTHSLIYTVFCNMFSLKATEDFNRYRPAAEQIFGLFIQAGR